jgi:hypothetical protein
MVTAQKPLLLGDAHNFGRRVAVGATLVHKPRTIFWEELVLGAGSELRRLLREIAKRDALGPEAFDFLPELTFSPSPDEPGGDVERIALAPLPRLSGAERRSLAVVTGRMIAFFSWLGVSDLHWENLVLGVGERGRVIFAPLDVEMILADLELPTETKLLPDADPEYAALCRHACGARRVLPYLGKPVERGDLVAMASSYAETLSFLERHAHAIAETIHRLPGLGEAPIRVCLRSTGDYVRAHESTLWPPLLAAEEEQLARGDVPYFFRLYGKAGIHYYANESLSRTKRLPVEGDVPQLDPILRLSRGLRSPNRKTLREEGLLAVLGAFDHPSFGDVGEEKPGEPRDGLKVAFHSRKLVVEFAGGEVIESRRDLSAFVGSVYLPCRCGEVRTVFVPPVTTCQGAPQERA